MSGHSKWSQIKRQKAVTDQKRGQAFTKLGRNISIAVKNGGSPDPEFNFKLRMAIEQARTYGMPNENIERAIKRASGEGKEAIEAVTYEGYGPGGSAFLVEAATDNKNRTTANIRSLFSKHDGRMGEQGSVSWMFESKGQVLVEKQEGMEELALELIDLGVEDVKGSEEGFEIYTLPLDLEKIKAHIENKGIKILNAEVVMRPQQSLTLSDPDKHKAMALTNALSDDEDVINVHSNVST
jgi:YebC/PmpR family DNA-binding regulatory protein